MDENSWQVFFPIYDYFGVFPLCQAYVCEDEHTKTSMLLPLAERMIEKFIKDEKIEAEAEVTVYLLVLEMQKKYKKALEVINGKLGKEYLAQFYKCF